MNHLPLRSLALACLALAGCLAPQEIEQVDPPDSGNAAPSILSRSPAATTVVSQQACGTLAFRLLGIRDRDRGDTLEVRWFVNYGPFDPEPWRPADSVPPPTDGASDIRIPPEFVLMTRHFVGQQLVVEAVVSDGFDPDPNAEPAGRAILPGRGHDETSWVVRITDEAECLSR